MNYLYSAQPHSNLCCFSLLCRKSEESSTSKKSDSASSDSDLPAEYLNSPLSRENQVTITDHKAFTSVLFSNTRLIPTIHKF